MLTVCLKCWGVVGLLYGLYGTVIQLLKLSSTETNANSDTKEVDWMEATSVLSRWAVEQGYGYVGYGKISGVASTGK